MTVASPVRATPDRTAITAAALMLVSTVAIAFNDLRGVLPVGELAFDAYIYVFPAIALFLLVQPGRLSLPPIIILYFVLAALVVALSFAANYGEIAEARFKDRGGLERMMTQLMALVFGLLITLATYNLVRLGAGRAMVLGSRVAILVMAAVGIVEIGSWLSLPVLSQLHLALAAIIHSESGESYPTRLRMTAFEVSWAAVMLTFFMPLAIVKLRERSRWPYLFALLALLMVGLSQSRTALLVFVMQAALAFWIVMRRRLDLAVFLLPVAVLGVVGISLSPRIYDQIADRVENVVTYGSFSPENDSAEFSVSNVTRGSSIRAGFSMFLDNPVLGVGFGQYGFAYPAHIRPEDLRSYEVRDQVAGDVGSWPKTYSLHARILGETGIVGYLAWLGLLLPHLVRSLRLADSTTSLGTLHRAIAMILFGWLLLGASIDTFRFFGGWMAIGLSVYLGRAAALDRAVYPPSTTVSGS